MEPKKTLKKIFGTSTKKSTVSPTAASQNDSSSADLSVTQAGPSTGPLSPRLVHGLNNDPSQGHTLTGSTSWRPRKETENTEKDEAEGGVPDGSLPIWLTRRVSQPNVAGRQRIAAEYHEKMEAFDDLIRNRRLALAHNVTSY